MSVIAITSYELALNELRAKAAKYLRVLYAFELSAGVNFRDARDFLKSCGRLPSNLEKDLTTAFDQEVLHANMVRRMFDRIASESHYSCSMAFRDFRNLTERLIEQGNMGRAAHTFQYMISNFELEDDFATSGLSAISRAISLIPELRDNMKEFRERVQVEEEWHVQLDLSIIKIYEDEFGLDRRKAHKFWLDRREEFRSYMKTKMDMLRFVRGQPELASRLV